MRVSENRYSRDLSKLNLAKRCIEHGLRTYWILLFTGLTEEQLRNLLRSYFRGSVAQRHRGQPPTSCAVLFSARYRPEASALAGMVKVLGLLPPTPVRSFRNLLPDIELGERLCAVFELFQFAAPGATISMDRLMLLVSALAEERLTVGECLKCRATLLVDPLTPRNPVCEACGQYRAWERARARGRRGGIPHVDNPSVAPGSVTEGVGEQQSLF